MLTSLLLQRWYCVDFAVGTETIWFRPSHSISPTHKQCRIYICGGPGIIKMWRFVSVTTNLIQIYYFLFRISYNNWKYILIIRDLKKIMSVDSISFVWRPGMTAPSLPLKSGPSPKIYLDKYHHNVSDQCVILLLFQSYLHQNFIYIYCLSHSSLRVQLHYPPSISLPKNMPTKQQI